MSDRDNLELIARYSKDHLEQSIGSHALSSNFISYALIVVLITLLAFWGTPDTWHVANVVLWLLVAFGCVTRLASLYTVPLFREMYNKDCSRGPTSGEVNCYLSYVCVFRVDRICANVLIVVALLIGGHFGKAIVLGAVCIVHMLVAYFSWRKSYPAALAAAQRATA